MLILNKTLRVILILIVLSCNIKAQPSFRGFTSQGNNSGTLFRTDINGRNEMVEYSFAEDVGGIIPYGGLNRKVVAKPEYKTLRTLNIKFKGVNKLNRTLLGCFVLYWT